MRQPRHDHIHATEPTWTDVPLGAGQEDTNRGVLQFTLQGDPIRRTDVRRKPGDDTAIVLHRPVNGAPA